MTKIVPDPPHQPLDAAPSERFFTTHTEPHNDEHHLFTVREGIGIDDILQHASELLTCTASSAYELADNYIGDQRSQAMALYHLVNMANTLVGAALESRDWQGNRLGQ